jgi:Zn-finger nucleic acid-binding protein
VIIRRRTGMTETKKCEYCGKSINIRYRICPVCGGQLQDSTVSIPPVCPRCRVPLEIQLHSGEEYDFCRRCGGMWLDRVEFHHATKPSDVYKKEAIRKEYLRQPVRGSLEYIPCVRCGKLMNRKNFGRISGVIIDECGKHGVWLDPGEIEKIRHFIADGGLEKSQDREIEKTRDELRSLATKVDQTTFTQKILHFWNFKRWLFGG